MIHRASSDFAYCIILIKTNLFFARQGHAIAVKGETIYVFGGSTTLEASTHFFFIICKNIPCILHLTYYALTHSTLKLD